MSRKYIIFLFSFAVETNYQNLYYLNDGVVVACALFSIFFLKVNQMSTSNNLVHGGELLLLFRVVK